MTKRIKIVGGKAPKVRITSKLVEKIDPNEIGSALGAERVSHVGADTASPTLQRLRVQLAPRTCTVTS